jgi:hypothetical protein
MPAKKRGRSTSTLSRALSSQQVINLIVDEPDPIPPPTDYVRSTPAPAQPMPSAVGDKVEFEWRIVDTQDPPAVREGTRWVKWGGTVVQVSPAMIAWREDCEDLEETLTAWPVAPNIADETFAFEERLATFTKTQPRIRPSLGLRSVTPHQPQFIGVQTMQPPIVQQLHPVSYHPAVVQPHPASHHVAPQQYTAGPQQYTAGHPYPPIAVHQFPPTSIQPIPTSYAPQFQMPFFVPPVNTSQAEEYGDAMRGEIAKQQLAPQLKIPKHMDTDFGWMYPHIFIGAPLDWGHQLRDFQAASNLFVRDAGRSLALEQSRKAIQAWLTERQEIPTTKEAFVNPFNLVATIISALIFARTMNHNKATQFGVDAATAFSKGFVDFPALWGTYTNKPQSVESKHPQDGSRHFSQERGRGRGRFRPGKGDRMQTPRGRGGRGRGSGHSTSAQHE